MKHFTTIKKIHFKYLNWKNLFEKEAIMFFAPILYKENFHAKINIFLILFYFRNLNTILNKESFQHVGKTCSKPVSKIYFFIHTYQYLSI